MTAVLVLALAAGAPELWHAEGETLRALVETATGADRGEALLRLGEWEREAADRIARASGETPQGDGLRDAADAHLSEAARQAASEFVPRALYALGDLRRARGRAKDAAGPLAELVRRFPDDALAADAALALGDDAFDAGSLAAAADRYRFAARAGNGRVEAWARYKLAWCHLNLEDHEQARAEFSRVVALSQEGRASFALADDARRDLVLALARDPSVRAADAADRLRSVAAPGRSSPLVEAYARIIADSGRDAEASRLLHALLPAAPPAGALRMLSLQVEIALRRRDGPSAVDAARAIASLAAEHRDLDASGAERAVRTAAVTLHAEGRAARRTGQLETALALYRAWFEAFSSSEAAYELHHHAGELLASLSRSAEAEREYTAAAEQDLARLSRGDAPGKWMAASARGAVEAALAAVGPVSDAGPASDEESDRPSPEPRAAQGAELRLLEACDRFLRLLPSDPGAPAVAYQRAGVLYRHGMLEQAAAAFRTVATGSTSEVSIASARLALDALRQLGRFDDLAALASELAALPAAARPPAAELIRVREGALLAAAARESAQGNHLEAARRYRDFVERFPASARLDRALYNGAAALDAAWRPAEAVALRARLLEHLPRSPLAARAKERQWADLVALGRFAEARRLLAPEEAARDADRLHEAIVVSEAAGDRRGADALRELYLSRHPRGPDAMAHALRLVDHAAGCASARRAAEKLVALARDPAWHAVALVRSAREDVRCGDKAAAQEKARRAARLASAIPASRPDGLDALAEAALLRTDPILERYRALALGEPWQRTLPRKIAALDEAERQLAAVVSTGRAAPAVCALVRSGDAWADLARALGAARAPRGLTAGQRELFLEDLSAKAQPLFDRAKTALATAVARAREAAVAPRCLDEAVTALARLDPGRWSVPAGAVATLTPAMASPGMRAAEVLARAPDAPAAWLLAAQAELAAGRPEAALVLAARISDDDPNAPAAAELRARALDAPDRRDAALALWTRLAQEHPERPLAHRVLADARLARRDFEGARERLETLRCLEPEASDAALDLGVALRGLGDAAGAEKALQAAASLAPASVEPLLNLGLLLCAEGGRPAEGMEMLDRFRERGGRAPDRRALDAATAACRALAGGGRSAER